MWHWPHVVGSRTMATEEVWRVWQAVQVPMVPSAFGWPTEWHFAQPVMPAASPSSLSSGLAGRFVAPAWYFSENATCSAVKGFSPYTAAHDGAACRLLRNCW